MNRYLALLLPLGCASASPPAPASAPPPARAAEVDATPDIPQQAPAVAAMDLEGLDAVLRSIDPALRGRLGAWDLEYQGIRMTCLAQGDVDRMRIFIPVAKMGDVTGQQLAAAMEANFHSALDARYATSRGVLFSVFIHPLSSLDEKWIRIAVHQVASLAVTFGTDYTSGLLRFGPQGKAI